MTPEQFKRLAQQNIFPGESGGDYNALFNYQNRPSGMFSDANLTGMTVDQALEFSSPSGPYGQYVKGQVGRVATPMGAYQVVGTTLRDAKAGLGLTGGEMMNAATQDRIGQYIFDTQGPEAWAGYTSNNGGQEIADQTMAAIGRRPTNSNLEPRGILSSKGDQMDQQQPQGLLSALGIQRRDPTAQGETAQPFYNRQAFGDTLARIAPALGRMGVMGLEVPAQAALDERNARQSDQRAMAKAEQQRNATADWFRSQGGDKWANAVLSGSLTGAQALSGFQAETAPTSASFVGLDQQARAAGLEPETPGYQEFMLNGGGAPANLRALQMQAIEAGLEPGTPEYQEFMATRGSGLSALASRTGTLNADINLGGAASGVSKAGEMMVANAFAAFEQAGKATTAIGTMNDAIAAIDGGARSGLVENFLPNVTEASASLNNAMNRMGLDVISSVTFGALSEAEMNLAMETAAPRNLDPEALRAWLVSKRDAQEKARDALLNAARYFGKPGNTLEGWIESQQSKNPATTADPQGGGATGGNTLTFNPDTGGFD
tara:strand:- start:12247 stop:13887 length:1641 start_codon:yes stop_codon:yes gene_type:complete